MPEMSQRAKRRFVRTLIRRTAGMTVYAYRGTILDRIRRTINKPEIPAEMYEDELHKLYHQLMQEDKDVRPHAEARQ